MDRCHPEHNADDFVEMQVGRVPFSTTQTRRQPAHFGVRRANDDADYDNSSQMSGHPNSHTVSRPPKGSLTNGRMDGAPNPNRPTTDNRTDPPTDGPNDGRTNGSTNARTDERTRRGSRTGNDRATKSHIERHNETISASPARILVLTFLRMPFACLSVCSVGSFADSVVRSLACSFVGRPFVRSFVRFLDSSIRSPSSSFRGFNFGIAAKHRKQPFK